MGSQRGRDWRVTDSGKLQVFHNGVEEASIRCLLAEGSPQYSPPAAEPGYLAEARDFDFESVISPGAFMEH